MYKNIAKAAKDASYGKSGQAKKKAMAKDLVRRVRKENIMDRGPLSGNKSSLM